MNIRLNACLLPLILLAVTFSGNSSSAATVTSGELIPNPFFSGGDYSGWTINSPWRNDGGNSRLVFDVNNTNTGGFPGSIILGKNLNSEANVTALDGYNPSTTKLTNLTFNSPFFATIALPPADGTYKFFVEFDLNTTGGTFTAKSQEFLNPWTIVGPQALSMSWNTDPFAGGGVALSDITSSEYKAFMFVEAPTSNVETTFFTVDNLSTTYSVTAVPEPYSLAFLSAPVGLFAARRRKKETVTASDVQLAG